MHRVAPQPGPARLPSRHSTATDITATDRPWPETFAVEGDLSAKFDRIPEGSSVQFR